MGELMTALLLLELGEISLNIHSLDDMPPHVQKRERDKKNFYSRTKQ